MNPDWMLRGLRKVFGLRSGNRSERVEFGRAGLKKVSDVERTMGF